MYPAPEEEVATGALAEELRCGKGDRVERSHDPENGDFTGLHQQQWGFMPGGAPQSLAMLV